LKKEIKLSNENNCDFLEFAGFKEIYNKNLELILVTKDSFATFLPNVCANVTFINFTTTIN